MKFSTAIVALAAVAAQAAAVRETGKEHTDLTGAIYKGVGYGSAPGSRASHAKRAAEAVAEALAEAEPKKKKSKVVGGLTNFCGVPGGSCNEKRDAAPEAKHGLFNFCGVPGSSCNEKREITDTLYNLASKTYNEIDAREAEADAKHGLFNFCGVPGSSCNEKREAEPKKKKSKVVGGLFNWCGVPGSSCNAKRDAQPDAYAEADAKHGLFNFCGVPGSSCNEKRSALADAKHGLFNFCGVPGSSCNEKRGQELERAVKGINPYNIKNECFQDGEACETIQHAHAAIKSVQRREAEMAKMSPAQKLAACGTSHDCSAATQAYLKALVAGHPEAKKAEAECHGPEGHCTLAARALDELEAAVEEGIASLDKF
ncbi:hypothetical protein LTR85_002174 [Meristemomyces frigidus]|nr:hypothetical protein LTR85_002174 [Meristemomyces frigidus]